MRSLAVGKGACDRCLDGLGKLTATSKSWGLKSGAIAMTVHLSKAIASARQVPPGDGIHRQERLYWFPVFSSAGQWL
jgi:hypothetical protein